MATVQSTGISGALIADTDPLSRFTIESALSRAGIKQIRFADHGQDAWDLIQQVGFGLVVMEWQLPVLSGLGLLNRIRRARELRDTPVIVLSSAIQPADFALLGEFPVTVHVAKPVVEEKIVAALSRLATDAAWNRENDALFSRVSLYSGGADGELVAAITRELTRAGGAVPLALFFARRLIDAERHRVAESLLRSVLKRDPQNVVAAHLLGRTLLLSKRFDEARTVLRVAAGISTRNMARLLELGEAELQNLDGHAALTAFEEALSIDSGDHTARDGVMVSRALTSPGVSINRPIDNLPRNFASLANAVGVSLVHQKRYAEATAHYQAALRFLGDLSDLARVRYNLGLGFWRWGRLDEARRWFLQSTETLPGGFDKARSCLAKIDRVDTNSDTSNEFELDDELQFTSLESDLAGLSKK